MKNVNRIKEILHIKNCLHVKKTIAIKNFANKMYFVSKKFGEFQLNMLNKFMLDFCLHFIVFTCNNLFLHQEFVYK